MVDDATSELSQKSHPQQEFGSHKDNLIPTLVHLYLDDIGTTRLDAPKFRDYVQQLLELTPEVTRETVGQIIESVKIGAEVTDRDIIRVVTQRCDVFHQGGKLSLTQTRGMLLGIAAARLSETVYPDASYYAVEALAAMALLSPAYIQGGNEALPNYKETLAPYSGFIKDVVSAGLHANERRELNSQLQDHFGIDLNGQTTYEPRTEKNSPFYSSFNRARSLPHP